MTPTHPAPAPARVDDETRLAYVALAGLPNTSWRYRTAVRDGAAATLDQLAASHLPAATIAWYRQQAVRELAHAQETGTRIVVPGDEEWPTRLTDLNGEDHEPGAPLCLWVRGPLNVRQALERSVLVTGTAAPTAYGRHVVCEIASHLAGGPAVWTVSSGGAYGIDRSAVSGALVAYDRRPCVVVLATGLDHLHTADATFDEIAATGLIVSPFPSGTGPSRTGIDRRLDILATLTIGTVVVEAHQRSRCLVAASRAAQRGRPVMAVPGPVTSANSVGCHRLIREGARLVTGGGDVRQELETRTG